MPSDRGKAKDLINVLRDTAQEIPEQLWGMIRGGRQGSASTHKWPRYSGNGSRGGNWRNSNGNRGFGGGGKSFGGRDSRRDYGSRGNDSNIGFGGVKH